MISVSAVANIFTAVTRANLLSLASLLMGDNMREDVRDGLPGLPGLPGLLGDSIGGGGIGLPAIRACVDGKSGLSVPRAPAGPAWGLTCDAISLSALKPSTYALSHFMDSSIRVTSWPSRLTCSAACGATNRLYSSVAFDKIFSKTEKPFGGSPFSSKKLNLFSSFCASDS